MDLPKAPGLLLLEHLNLNVMSTEVALAFYTALGCSRDERRPLNKTLHSNCGALTQFHTPSPTNEAYIGSEGAQTWRGEIELLYASPTEITEALERLQALAGDERFVGSQFRLSSDKDGEATVTGPYGNVFKLRVAAPEQAAHLGPDSGARPGSERSSCVGLGAASLRVPPGTASRGARFYAQVFGFEARELEEGRWAVVGGPGGSSQQLVLVDTPGCTGEELGEHVAVYIGDFEGCFQRLHDRGLIFVNPRFVHLDKASTLEEAMHYQCFRFKSIVDVDSGEKLFELEHEVRSVAHKQYPLKSAAQP